MNEAARSIYGSLNADSEFENRKKVSHKRYVQERARSPFLKVPPENSIDQNYEDIVKNGTEKR